MKIAFCGLFITLNMARVRLYKSKLNEIQQQDGGDANQGQAQQQQAVKAAQQQAQQQAQNNQKQQQAVQIATDIENLLKRKAAQDKNIDDQIRQKQMQYIQLTGAAYQSPGAQA